MNTVVVVEDNQALREMFELAFKNAGYTVIVAEDGLSALALSESIKDDGIILLTDVVLPGMNGLDLAVEFVHRHPRARVGMMSGWRGHRLLTGLDVLLKPFSLTEMLDFVAKIGSPSSIPLGEASTRADQ